jgi:hypothetical protein
MDAYAGRDVDTEDAIEAAQAESERQLDAERRTVSPPVADVLKAVMADGTIPYSLKPAEYRRRLAGHSRGEEES